MSETNAKSWVYSKTIWGVAVMALAGAAQQLGIADITPESQAQVVDWILNVVAVRATGLASWGRISANRRIA